MKNPIKMDDLEGKPTIFGNIHIEILPPPKKSNSNHVFVSFQQPGFA